MAFIYKRYGYQWVAVGPLEECDSVTPGETITCMRADGTSTEAVVTDRHVFKALEAANGRPARAEGLFFTQKNGSKIGAWHLVPAESTGRTVVGLRSLREAMVLQGLTAEQIEAVIAATAPVTEEETPAPVAPAKPASQPVRSAGKAGTRR